MSEHESATQQHCCEEECCEEYYEEGVEPMPTELPFQEWPNMAFPPLVFTRWRLPKFLGGQEGGKAGRREGDGVVPVVAPDAAAAPRAFWPLRVERPQIRLRHFGSERRRPRRQRLILVSPEKHASFRIPDWRRAHPSPRTRHVKKWF